MFLNTFQHKTFKKSDELLVIKKHQSLNLELR